jgi:ATP-dependent exoDNAse (exonuclease V) alpha subunit
VTTSRHFRSAKHHRLPLGDAKRFETDPDYLDFLNLIRDVTPSQECVEQVLGACCMSEKDAFKEIRPEDTLICTMKADVKMWNDKLLNKFYGDGQIPELRREMVVLKPHGQPPPHDSATPAERDAIMAFYEPHQSEAVNTSKVCLGARVMFLQNVSVARGASNGATGVVRGWRGGDTITGLDVEVDGNPGAPLVRVNRSMVVISRIGNFLCKKTVFPLSLGYAVTAHKCQGATFDTPTYIYAKDVFMVGLMYVMLSRVVDRKFLKIIGSVTASDILPVPDLLD